MTLSPHGKVALKRKRALSQRSAAGSSDERPRRKLVSAKAKGKADAVAKGNTLPSTSCVPKPGCCGNCGNGKKVAPYDCSLHSIQMFVAHVSRHILCKYVFVALSVVNIEP